MNGPTASALPRLLACPGSAALPEARTTSEWADAGTDRHADQQDAIDAGSLDEMPDAVRALLPADTTSLRAEVAVVYDVASGTARELGTGLGRNYGPLGPFEIPGTIDLLALAPGRAVVCDWKGFEQVDGPDRNAQTMLYALAVARLYGLDEITVAICYLGTGAPPKYAVLDTFDLDAFADRLRRLYVDVGEQRARVAAGHLPDVSESKECKYCPAAHVCPAKVALLRWLATGTEANELELMVPFDPGSARLAYERLQAGKNLLKRVERALYAYAAEHAIPLGDGKFFGKRVKLGNEKLDGDTVYTVVEERLGREFADRVVIRSATKARLEEALKQAGVAAVGGPVGKVKDAILAEVRKRGGAKREETEVTEEFTAMPRLVEASNG